eukprot:m.550443 g.550443  ORF g.550443 m.550443 type:complete len:424 (-) comp57731_c0_seq7:1329-2600(-)
MSQWALRTAACRIPIQACQLLCSSRQLHPPNTRDSAARTAAARCRLDSLPPFPRGFDNIKYVAWPQGELVELSALGSRVHVVGRQVVKLSEYSRPSIEITAHSIQPWRLPYVCSPAVPLSSDSTAPQATQAWDLVLRLAASCFSVETLPSLYLDFKISLILSMVLVACEASEALHLLAIEEMGESGVQMVCTEAARILERARSQSVVLLNHPRSAADLFGKVAWDTLLDCPILQSGTLLQGHGVNILPHLAALSPSLLSSLADLLQTGQSRVFTPAAIRKRSPSHPELHLVPFAGCLWAQCERKTGRSSLEATTNDFFADFAKTNDRQLLSVIRSKNSLFPPMKHNLQLESIYRSDTNWRQGGPVVAVRSGAGLQFAAISPSRRRSLHLAAGSACWPPRGTFISSHAAGCRCDCASSTRLFCG